MQRQGDDEVWLLLILDPGTISVSGQGQAPVALYPRGKDTRCPYIRAWVSLRGSLDAEARGKIFCLCRESSPGHPVVQSTDRHYTDWATPTLVCLNIGMLNYSITEKALLMERFWSLHNESVDSVYVLFVVSTETKLRNEMAYKSSACNLTSRKVFMIRLLTQSVFTCLCLAV
jgi:hypothetical protein